MADDSRFRSPRPGSAYPRVTAPSRSGEYAGASDPLAELARLIGKNDPYAEFGLSDSSAHEREENYLPGAPVHDERHAAAHGHSHAPEPEQHHAPAPEHYPEPYSTSYDRRERGDYARYASSLPPARDSRHEPRLESWPAEHASDALHQPFGDAPGAPHAAPYGEDRGSQQYDEADTDEPYYEEDDQFDPHAETALDQSYDDPARAGRRGGLATALALIGCAMLGTAGAYGYRSYYSPTAATQPPPVITADNSTPTKIVPAAAGDAQSGKIIQDRVANAGREQIVSKQEEPVALRDIGTQAAPRVVLPAPVAAVTAPSPQIPAGTGSAGPNEPKKVRTLTIRPDGSDASARLAPSAGQAPGQPAGAAAARGAGAARSSGGPLSLDPQANESAPAPPARTRTAMPQPTRSGSEPPAASSGGFLVQLSSQKTEAEASSSFRSLQAKFPNELSGKTTIIRRADLGAKGVFYRTMVGPFASLQEAQQFCASFKAAGGTCVVPSN